MNESFKKLLCKCFLYTLLCVCFFTVFYLLMSFANTDLNFLNWKQIDRNNVVLLTGVSMVLKLMADGINRVANE